jgi:hypothetical protein
VTAKKKLELFTRRERVAIRNLSPGTYTVTYRPVFQSRRSRDQKILGKYSAKQFFTRAISFLNQPPMIIEDSFALDNLI